MLTRRQIPFFNYPALFAPDEQELMALMRDVLSRGAYILQKDLKEFEAALAKYLNVKHAFGMADGTNAIVLALRAANVGPGDEVIVPSHTFIASVYPIKALGATDQHSQVQLYREGPNDKAIGLVEVESFGEADSLRTPAGGAMGVEALAYLEGKGFGELLNAEKRATEYALVESRRPNFTIRLPRVDAHAVGEFIQLWQVATAYAGLMKELEGR